VQLRSKTQFWNEERAVLQFRRAANGSLRPQDDGAGNKSLQGTVATVPLKVLPHLAAKISNKKAVHLPSKSTDESRCNYI
jgi:hypothetical protein